MKMRKLLLSVALIGCLSGLNNQTAMAATKKTPTYKPGVPWEKEHNHRFDVQPTHKGNVIYYQMKIGSSNPYYYVWKTAISNWNALDVVHLKPISRHYHGYRITLSGNYDLKKGHDDLTAHNDETTEVANTDFYTENAQHNRKLAYFTSAKASLNPILVNWNLKFQTIAAEHELGHILGFNHDSSRVKDRPHVMNATIHANALPLGSHERKALKQMYK